MRRARLVAVFGVALSVVAGGVIAASPASSAPPPPLRHLDPGGQPSLTERLPVNVVFVGYDDSR